MRAAKGGGKAPVTISPAMYAVHGKAGIRRLKLGRTSSISTRCVVVPQIAKKKHNAWWD